MKSVLYRFIRHSAFSSLDELERLHIQQVFAATGRNLGRTAEILGITRTTLYNKIRKYGLDSA